MALPSKPLDQITEADLLALIQANEAESKTIDYKTALPGNSDAEKKEFLYDVSSFANAAGGHLVFGMKEQGGIPTELVGTKQPNADAEKLRLHNMIQSGVQPRIPSIEIHAVKLKTGDYSFLLRIPRSWASPHMVTFQGASKFYSRNSAGKYQLDVSEIRSAFALSDSLGSHIASFRSSRIEKIIADETPIRLNGDAKLAVHLLPANSFSPGFRVDLSQIAKMPGSPFSPMQVFQGWGSSHNFDGLAFYEARQNDFCIGYTQVFRNGCAEVVDSLLLRPRREGSYVPGITYERMLVDYLLKVLAIQKHLGIEPPIAIMLSMLNVHGYRMLYDNPYDDTFGAHPIDRNHLIVPEALIESFDTDLPSALKPAFDSIWNACGYPSSKNYDQNGIWKKPIHS